MLKKYALLIILAAPYVTGVAQDFEIEGLILDQTISPAGHLFYDALIDGWDMSKNTSPISVHELPDIIRGNLIWVEIEDVMVYRERLGMRPTDIEEKALSARSSVSSYIKQKDETSRQLEIY